MSIQTSCRDCVFGIFDKDNAQTDCHFDRISKFKANGADILPYGDPEKRWVQIDRYCNLCRTPGWEHFIGGGLSKEHYMACARQEVQNKTSFLAVLFDFKDDFQHIIDKAHELGNQSLKPKKIHVITLKKHDRLSRLKEVFACHNSWSIETVLDKSITTKERIFNTIKKHDCAYTLLYNSLLGTNDYFRDIESQLNDELKQLYVHINGSSLLFQSAMYKLMYQMYNCGPHTILYKIQKLMEEQKCNSSHLVR